MDWGPVPSGQPTVHKPKRPRNVSDICLLQKMVLRWIPPTSFIPGVYKYLEVEMVVRCVSGQWAMGWGDLGTFQHFSTKGQSLSPVWKTTVNLKGEQLFCDDCVAQCESTPRMLTFVELCINTGLPTSGISAPRGKQPLSLRCLRWL